VLIVSFVSEAMYSDSYFRSKVDKALVSVRTILDTTRAPVLPSSLSHQYNDKFGLAEFLANTSVASLLTCLEMVGLNDAKLKRLKEWSGTRSVTLRFNCTETCAFVREATRKVESATQYVTETTSSFLGKSTRTEKVITTITEYFWAYEYEYSTVAFQGNNSDDAIKFTARRGKFEIVTTTKSQPRPVSVVHSPRDVQITWLLELLASPQSLQCAFRIDRTQKSCRTPRRNNEVYSLLSNAATLARWSESVREAFNGLFAVQTTNALDMSAINADTIFSPIIPLFEHRLGGAAAGGAAAAAPASSALVSFNPATWPADPVLPIGDVNAFIAEQKRSFAAKFTDLAKAFPASGAAQLISVVEAELKEKLLALPVLCQQLRDGIEFIESMLHSQLVAAIGKEVTPADFINYMKFHCRKLYRKEFEPRPFCYAIRRPDHFPEGIVSIDSVNGNGTEPVYTTVRAVQPVTPMHFPINAATNIRFLGDRYLHAMLLHQFAGVTGSSLQITCRARQFSSFMVVLGRIAGADLFDPKHAIILQNKDDLTIPLMLEQLPTAREFKDAIESLSPEQQRFAKMYRSMQLESSMFGMVVIQLKPQLECLLNLPHDSLTKEIALTQDLLELFIKYQIPSDLLTFDPVTDLHANDATAKIAAVKRHVADIRSMINKSSVIQLSETSLRADYAIESSIAYECVPCPAPPMAFASSSMPCAPPSAAMCAPSAPMRRSAAAPGGGAAVLSRSAVAKPSAAPVNRPKPTSTSSTPSSSTPAQTGTRSDDCESSPCEDVEAFDYTKVPVELDRRFEALDEDSCLRPTIINMGTSWSKQYQQSLLSSMQSTTLYESDLVTERNKAFDLLDALSRSGTLDIQAAELHVIVAATHCFDKSLMDTVIQDSVNPIEKLERSSLLIATTIQQREAIALIKPDQVERIATFSAPRLLPEAARSLLPGGAAL